MYQRMKIKNDAPRSGSGVREVLVFKKGGSQPERWRKRQRLCYHGEGIEALGSSRVVRERGMYDGAQRH